MFDSLFRVIQILFFFSFWQGCTQKEKALTYDQVELYTLAVKEDPKAAPVLGDLAETTKNLCEEFKYQNGCQKVIRAKVLNLEIIFVQFLTAEDAKREATRIDQWAARNWVIDDVTGEPPLERFVQKVYGAVRPKASHP